MTVELDLEAHAAPIAGPNPTGTNLRYTGVYDQIKEAKRADDRMDRGEWEIDLKNADWALVCKICSDALKYKTKDLQIAAWFTEALLHRQGFAGLEFGLQLISRLLSDYWDSLYPEIEDGDLEYRAGPLDYLVKKLPNAVRHVPICDPERSKGFSYSAWEASRQKGQVSGEAFTIAVNLSDTEFYKDLHRRLVASRDQWRRLENMADRLLGSDLPANFSSPGDTMDECLQVVEKIYTEKQKSEIDAKEAENVNPRTTDTIRPSFSDAKDADLQTMDKNLFAEQNAITDISDAEKALWKTAAGNAGNGNLKNALDRLMAAAALAPSVRQKNRYLLLVAKLCVKAGRPDLAQPIAEQLYQLIESLKLENWEHPAWIADVIETLYRCLEKESNDASKRKTELFQKLCILNTTKAATYGICGLE